MLQLPESAQRKFPVELVQLLVAADAGCVHGADETAKEVYRVLTERDLLRTDPRPPEHRFLATGDQAPFARLAQRFLGPTVPSTGITPVNPPLAAAVGVAR